MSNFRNKLYLIDKWLLSFISIWLTNRTRLKFDKSLYKIPEVGEKIIITKEFYWNGGFLKRPEHTKPYFPNRVVKVEKNSEYIVEDVLEFKDDWRIRLSENIYLDYFKTRKYWTTKSEQRDNKLKKLGI